MKLRAWMIAAVFGVLASSAQGQCVGDCNGNGVVSVDELVLGVGIGLGQFDLSACDAFDGNGEGSLTVDLLVAGVDNSIFGCPGRRTPTATPTVTPTPMPDTPTPTPTSTPTPTETPGMTSFSSLDFIVGDPPPGTCGASRDGSGSVLKEIAYGLDYVGGGGSQAPPIAAARLRARFAVTGCDGTTCTLGPTDEAQAAPLECTDTGCPQGPPMPNTVPLPTCSATTWGAPGEGSFDTSDGTVTIFLHASAHSWINAASAAPCPRCIDGTCESGARAGLPCTSTSPDGVTNDCLPGGEDASIDLGVLKLDIELKTDAQSITTPDGVFCDGQVTAPRPGLIGCFGSQQCRTIEVAGQPAAGGLLPPGSPHEVRVATLACVPKTGNGTIDPTTDLPGPAALCYGSEITLNP